MRKRDPRYKAHLARQAEAGRNQASGSATPAGAALAKRPTDAYVEQEWQKVETHTQHGDLEWAAAEGDDPEEWECVACGKTFRSEAAWDSHERSKKHMKEVERLIKEMEDEEEELGLEEPEDLEGLRYMGDIEDLEGVEEFETMMKAPTEPQDIKLPDSLQPPNPVPETEPRIKESPTLDPGSTQPPEINSDERQRSPRPKAKVKKTNRVPEEPLSKTERKARRIVDSGDLDNLLDARAAADLWGSSHSPVTLESDGNAPPVEDAAGTPSEVTKRDKRRARQAKKGDVGEADTQVRSCVSKMSLRFPGMTRPPKDSMQCLQPDVSE